MSNATRKNKPVSFNLTDPNDLKLLDHAEKENPITKKPQNFSKYIKRLIEEDIRREAAMKNGGGESNGIQFIIEGAVSDNPDDYTMEAMSGFL